MKISAESTKSPNDATSSKPERPQVVTSKDTVGGMLVVGLGPGIRKAA